MKQSPILFNDFSRLWDDISPEALNALDRVGRSGWLILGKEVAEFEQELASFSRLDRCVGVANGLDAIEICLRALGLQCGEKVLTTPLSAFATSLAIIRAGGQPVFVDTDEKGLIDLEACRGYLRVNRDVRFMVPVHLFGHAVDLQELQRLKEEFSLLIVEDCAQSVGSGSHGLPVGSVGQMAATSFYPTKNLGCLGDGGAIFTSDVTLESKARCLRDYGQSAKYVHDELGLNSRLDEVQAAILRSALLPKLHEFTEIRRTIASKYCEGLSHSHIEVIQEPANCFSVWHLFPIRVRRNRESLQDHLKSRGVMTGIHYPMLIPYQKALADLPSARDKFPVAESIASTELSLPIHPYLIPEQIERVIAACNSWECA